MSTSTQPKLYGAVRKLGKGFGFIAGDDGQDYFFHWTGVVGREFNDVKMKERVSFIKTETPKGWRAILVEGVLPETVSEVVSIGGCIK
jgi:CspA family cold shock protein